MIFFSVDYEKLTYEFLQRKMTLEKLKEAHEELENVNLTLMVQQGFEVKSKNDSVSPCLTCLDRNKIDPLSKGKEPIVINDTNASEEEHSAVTEELLRLKDLFETGMFKSIQDINISVIFSRKHFFIETLARKVLVTKGN